MKHIVVGFTMRRNMYLSNMIRFISHLCFVKRQSLNLGNVQDVKLSVCFRAYSTDFLFYMKIMQTLLFNLFWYAYYNFFSLLHHGKENPKMHYSED